MTWTRSEFRSIVRGPGCVLAALGSVVVARSANAAGESSAPGAAASTPAATPSPASTSGPAPSPDREIEALAARARLVNRTILGAAGESYTAWDASLLLCAWNALGSAPVPLGTPWLAPDGRMRARLAASDTSAWPADARRLLFLALVWGESRKLNLFVPTEKDLDAAVGTLRDAGCRIEGDGREGGSPEAAAFLRTLPDARWRFFADAALRAKGFERVRGGLEKNRALLGQSWSWHTEATRD